MQIAFITVCKGRLAHVRETLPRILEQAPDEVVIVDFDCPDGVGAWVEARYPTVKVVRVSDPEGFCVAKGRNAGAAATRAPWLCFIDADILIQPGFVAWARHNVRPGAFFRAAPVQGVRDPETWGTCIVPRRAFEALSGFDETFRGWGGEDADLYRRLGALGVKMTQYPGELVQAIAHDEQVRLRFYEVKERHTHNLINSCYMALKSQVVGLSGKSYQLPPELKRDLMRKSEDAILGWDRSKPRPTRLSLQLSGHRRLLGRFRMGFTCTLDVEIEEDTNASASEFLAHPDE